MVEHQARKVRELQNVRLLPYTGAVILSEDATCASSGDTRASTDSHSGETLFTKIERDYILEVWTTAWRDGERGALHGAGVFRAL